MQRLLSHVLLGLALLAGGLARAEPYPGRPITLIVPFAAGEPADRVARLLGPSMSQTLGQQVLVENVGGEGGTRGAARAATAAPDGYTLLLHDIGHAAAPGLKRELSYDPLEAFEPIGGVADVPMALVGRKGLPAKDLRGLRAYIKDHGDKVLLANAGIGTASHLCGLLFQRAIKTELTALDYAGAGAAMSDLAGGRVELMCELTTNAARELAGGAIKAYGVTTRSRVAWLPGVPTLAEAGLRGFEMVVWHGLYAPRGTPRPIVDRLVTALQGALADPELKARLAEVGALPVPAQQGRPEALRKRLQAEVARWRPLLTRPGAQAH